MMEFTQVEHPAFPAGAGVVASLAASVGRGLHSVGCSESQAAGASSPPEKVHGVALLQVQKTTVPDVVEATGTVRAALSAQLASQVMGTITRVNVHEGDRVRRGEVLVSIDEAQQQAAYAGAKAGLQASQETIAAADADYALAEATMKRYQMLYDKKSVSPQEYDEVKTKLAAAQARRDAAHAGRSQAEAGVSQASTAMGFTKVRAPFDGVVIAKLAEPGAMAAPGVPLLMVEDPSRFRLEAQVDESKMGAVKLGETVPVVDRCARRSAHEGKVIQIVPAADPASRTFTVKIDCRRPIAKSAIRWHCVSGRSVRASALSARDSARPSRFRKSAVLSRGQLQAVYVIGKDQLASLRYVTLGAASGEQVEVLSGLQSGRPHRRTAGRSRVERQAGRGAVMAEIKTPMRHCRRAGRAVHQFEADAAVHPVLAAAGRIRHSAHAARGRAADRRADARRIRADAGCVGGRSRAARQYSDGAAVARSAGRGVRVLDLAARHEHAGGALLRRHQRRRRDRQDVQQAVLELRPHSAGRFAAAH